MILNSIRESSLLRMKIIKNGLETILMQDRLSNSSILNKYLFFYLDVVK